MFLLHGLNPFDYPVMHHSKLLLPYVDCVALRKLELDCMGKR